jgi:hypothetical protein
MRWRDRDWRLRVIRTFTVEGRLANRTRRRTEGVEVMREDLARALTRATGSSCWRPSASNRWKK